ncbi:MAG: DUF4440 domain-containing protein [Alphaproteobacteria bacterium]|nr:DUF4440 domain-containing protein [Alphaproteobacteria bacterium]
MLRANLQVEVEAVHVFIAAWFRGDVAKDRGEFDRQLGQRFHPEMINIQPSGRALNMTELLEPIFDAHGSNPNFQISIREFQLVAIKGEIAMATYIEDQTGARNSTPNNSRISSVLFELRGAESKPVWRHLHETALG